MAFMHEPDLMILIASEQLGLRKAPKIIDPKTTTILVTVNKH